MPSSHSRTYRSDSPARLASSPLVAGPARANCLNRPSRSPGAVSLEREGGYWAVRHAGTVARLPDSLGLRYLNLLIRNPGRELAALDMIRLASAAPASTAPSGAAPPGPVLHPVAATAADDSLDARALAEYRHRLAELDDELAEAERWNDTERASRARAERDFLLRELASATGIHGGPRRLGSESERARVNVTRAIRSAIDRVRPHSPEAAAHLDQAVRTAPTPRTQPRDNGLTCSRPWLSGCSRRRGVLSPPAAWCRDI